MEYFLQAKFVRLRTCRHKFLVAGDDGESVKQSRHGHTKKARWTVELVHDKPNLIRLRSCHNKLLTASDEPFLLGWTGKRVLQTVQTDCNNPAAHWEPIRKDFYVKLQAPLTGKFLRANRGTPPWKNSVTVDVPERRATRKWILWQVDILDAEVGGDHCLLPRNCRSFQPATNGETNYKTSNSMPNEEGQESTTATSSECEEDEGFSIWSETESEGVDLPTSSSSRAYTRQSGMGNGMELLQNAKTVRLRSHHGKYLVADEDQDSVSQDKKNGGSKRARWTVEYVNSKGVVLVRLKSCYDKYLTATDDKYLTGATGKKVKQTTPQRLDSSLEWEPIREGMHLKLKTRYGNFLRANGGVPPWRNTVTHDSPSRTQSQDWVLWDLDVLEVYDVRDKVHKDKDEGNSDIEEDDGEVQLPSHVSFKKAGIEGRVVHYNVVDDDGNIVEGERSLVFQGKSVEDLSKMLEKETGLSHVIVCSRNPLNGKLYPIMLALPPNHVKLHIYVVPSSSKVAEELLTI